MCGILGSVPAVERAFFEKALNSLIHRGPDGSGIWSDGDRAMLGQRRLAILDLSDLGAQPMTSTDGRYTLTYNGEIYNFLELRDALVALGHTFVSESDTEVLLAAYRQWGADGLMRCNGMWAVAIWDSQEGMLFLSRDRFGKKPLFYAIVDGRLIFASEMKALYPFLPRVEPSADFAWMAQHIFDYEVTSKCLVAGINRFPAGHHGWWDGASLTLRRYWNTLDHLEEVPRRYEDQVERFRELFLDSCKIRMRSDVPVGTALSGGLDSSATISAMAHIGRMHPGMRVSESWQHAFVATFPGTPFDETKFARKVVEHIGIDATFVEIDPRRDVNRFDEIFYRFEELYITSPVPMLQTYAAVRSHGTVVTLDGHGADELLGGYNEAAVRAMRDCAPWRVPGLRNVFNAMLPDDPQFANQRLGLVRAFARQAKFRIRGGVEPRSPDAAHPAYRGFDAMGRYLYGVFHETILPTLLRNYDRYSMASGVEIRMPLMDHRLVTYAFSLPSASKLRGGLTKRILRDAAAPYMPHEIAYRPGKIGFNSPILDWMRGPWKEMFLDTLESRDFRECTLIDSDRVAQEIRHAIDDDVPFRVAEQAWTDIAPYFWERGLRSGQKLGTPPPRLHPQPAGMH